jgi:apolipoprotein N-acyltransferase
MPVMINAADARWNKYKIDFEKIARLSGAGGAEVSITLTNDAEIRKLNKKYRNIDAPTNVLSFETGDKELLGDIFISFDTAMKEAGEKGFKDHLTHLVVHGILHLRGMDHMNGREARIMENRETEILSVMGIKNPHAKLPAFWKAIGLFALGTIGALGFAPYCLFPLTVVSIGMAYLFCRGYGDGFFWGAGYGLASFHWAMESVFANAELARQFWYFYPIGLTAIAIGSGLFFGLPFFMTKITNSTGGRRALYFALAWTSTLWLREWFLTGFPWNPIANITLPSPAIAGLMSIIGALGLTFIIVGCAAASAEYIRSGTKSALLFFIPLVLSFALPRAATEFSDFNIRIVQPAFDMNQKFDANSADDNVKTLVKLSKTKSKEKIDLIIWPETAYPYIVKYYDILPATGAPLIAGAVAWNGKMYNAMVLADAFGRPRNWYWKAHLVPFGEYRPFGDWIPTPGQLTAGPGPRTMKVGNVAFAPAICYEIVFSDSLIPRGARPDFILNITNDAWFGFSSGPHQHLDMARRQAIETGLPVIRANQAGISAIIDGNGRVLSRLELNITGTLDGRVPKGRITIYRHIGLNGMMLLILLFCGIILILPNLPRPFGAPLQGGEQACVERLDE